MIAQTTSQALFEAYPPSLQHGNAHGKPYTTAVSHWHTISSCLPSVLRYHCLGDRTESNEGRSKQRRTMANSFPQIRASAVDGRAVNVLYRQRQVERLHDAITKASTEILKAIEIDYDQSPAEAATEMYLAMQALKSDYASLQPKQAHHDEYLIASGKNASSNRKPVGVVYIEPCSTHTLFYSVIVPLSSAMAAGNCVIVLVSDIAYITQRKRTDESASLRATCARCQAS